MLHAATAPVLQEQNRSRSCLGVDAVGEAPSNRVESVIVVKRRRGMLSMFT